MKRWMVLLIGLSFCAGYSFVAFAENTTEKKAAEAVAVPPKASTASANPTEEAAQAPAPETPTATTAPTEKAAQIPVQKASVASPNAQQPASAPNATNSQSAPRDEKKVVSST